MGAIARRVLGCIDLAAAIAFLMLTFGMAVSFQYLLFSAGLLLVKSFFMLAGDVLSFIDFFSSLILVFSIFFSLPAIFLWIPAFLLLAKATVSFI